MCRKGEVLKAQGYGLANVEHRVPVTPETVFQSGSVGKQFTAAGAMFLVEEGKLDLDDPVTRHLPDAPEPWKAIRVRHLLTHTSGIKEYESGKEIDLRRDYTEEELLQTVYRLPLDFAPGTRWSYSNTGYVVLGVLLRRVSGQFYGDLLAGRVFRPLGMRATRIISEADIVPNRAAGYRADEHGLKNQDWVSPSLNTTADGALYVTVLDLAKWDAALDGEKLLKARSWAQIFTPVRLADGATHPYGFGWALREQRGHPNIEHSGSWQGFEAHIARYVDQRLSVIVLTNLARCDPGLVAHGIAGLLEPLLRLPDVHQPGLDPDPRRTAAVRDVLFAWARGESAPHMGPGLQAAAMSPLESFLRERTASRIANATSFAYLGEDDVRGRSIERRGARVTSILHYALGAGDETRAYRLYLDAAGDVIDLWF